MAAGNSVATPNPVTAQAIMNSHGDCARSDSPKTTAVPDMATRVHQRSPRALTIRSPLKRPTVIATVKVTNPHPTVALGAPMSAR